MIEAKPAADQIEARVDVLCSPSETVLNFLGGLLVEELEFCLSGEGRVYRALQPVEVETVIRLVT